MEKEKILIIPNDPFSEYLLSRGKETVEKYFNPLLKFEVHIVSFEDCYKYPSKEIGTLIIHPFYEKQFKKTIFYPWRVIRVLSRILLRIKKTYGIVKKYNLELIICYGMSLYTFIGFKVSKLLRKPFVIVLHNDYDYMFKIKGKLKFIFWHTLETILIKYSTCVIAPSPFLVEYAKKHGSKNVSLIYDFPDLALFTVRKKGKSTKSKKVLLFAGRFYDPQKNFERLLIAYSKVRKDLRKKSELFVLGDDGGKLDYFKNLTEKLGIEGNVRFIGKVPRSEMPVWYEKADFLVLPSLYEALPFTILEAMSMGLVILTSNHPSCSYLVDNDNGILVAPLNTDYIKKGIEKLLEMTDEEYRNKSKNSVQKIKKFNREKEDEKKCKLYKNLIYKKKI